MNQIDLPEQAVATQPDKPGFYYSVSLEDYRSWPAINISVLKEMDKTPQHVSYRRSHPLDQTEEMMVGSAAHCRILEPDKWDSRFYVCPPCKLNTKEGKAIMADAVIEANGRTVIRMSDDAEASAAEEMADAINRHELAWKLIGSHGRCEVSALWFDELNKFWCKGRFDKLIEDREKPLIVEIKTSGRIDNFHFGRTAKSLHYDAQAAWYLWGHACITGQDAEHQILAIESKPPFTCRVLQMDSEGLQGGATDYARWFGAYCHCIRSGKWPGYPETVETLKVPQYGGELEILVGGKEYQL
jgi:hypothetical protein